MRRKSSSPQSGKPYDDDVMATMGELAARRMQLAVSALTALKGSSISIEESISRRRGEAWSHDRHFAVDSILFMKLGSVGIAFSGTSLTLEGTHGGLSVWYGVAFDAVVDVHMVNEKTLVLTEHFALQTERTTTVRRIDG